MCKQMINIELLVWDYNTWIHLTERKQINIKLNYYYKIVILKTI